MYSEYCTVQIVTLRGFERFMAAGNTYKASDHGNPRKIPAADNILPFLEQLFKFYSFKGTASRDFLAYNILF